ncbi:MAG: ABC transporter permease [Bacteroidetes bacterium]|nr:ABC transporter permease [Bacteroidota bacterium]
MFRNYMRVALRNVLKHKVHSFINVTGLAIGLASFVLIFLYVQDELSYDRYHEKADRIYRVTSEVPGAEFSASMAFPVGHTLQVDYPNFVESYVRFFNFQAPTVAMTYQPDGGERIRFNEPNFFLADSTLWDVFDFELLVGDKKTALAQPNNILLTERMVEKYFRNEDPIGKVIQLENQGTINFTVAGILANPRTNSHFEYDFLASINTLNAFQNGQPFQDNNWYWNPAWTYILMAPGVDIATFESFFPDFVQKYWPAFIKDNAFMYLQKLTDIHLTSRLDFEIRPNSDIAYVWIFSAIALFILLIACINFMNLTTARSGQRAREVGLRKVLGAVKGQLVRQFLSESILLVALALMVAIPLIYAGLPVLNGFAGKSLTFSPMGNPMLFLGLIGIVFVVGSLSGLYPAFFLSAFQPVLVLKNMLTVGRTDVSGLLRKGLVVTQFGISILLIVGTFVAYDQLEFMQSKNLGFDKEEVVLIPILGTPLTPQYKAFKDQLLQNNNIVAVTALEDVPGSKYQTDSFQFEGMPDPIQFPRLTVHDDAVEVLGMELVAGRGYSEDFPADSAAAIMVNEAMLPLLGHQTAEDALGHRITLRNQQKEIVGVVKDFHYASLHNPIGPFIVERFFGPGIFNFFGRYVAVRMQPGDPAATLAFLEEQWRRFVPDRPFEYRFLDAELDKLYTAEQTLGQVATIFSIMAIFVACLGLFGMASFTAERRTKEIGVRKVLGATELGIITLLTKESARLVVIAFVLSAPLAWWAISKWLQTFTYATTVNPLSFLVAGIAVFVVAILTVGLQSIRTATANPVESIHYE